MVDLVLTATFDPSLIEPQQIRLLSRREYDRLVELDWFVDEPIELLRGVLVTMSPTLLPDVTIRVADIPR